MEYCHGFRFICAMSIDEDEGHSIEVFSSEQGECKIKQMMEYQKEIVDPAFNLLASLDLEVSDNIVALKD